MENLKIYHKKRGIALILALTMFFCAVPVTEAEAAKGRWKVKKSGRYYVKPGGGYARGCYKIKGKYYVFSAKGKLFRPKKNSLVNVRGRTYGVSPGGIALTGWHVVGDQLYNMEKTGAVRKNIRCQGIELSGSGAAINSRKAEMKMVIVRAVDTAVKEKMTKSQKLYACWKYLCSKKRFQYAPKYPDLTEEGWQRDTAYDMLKTKKGNCYSFACAFAAMADELGYESYVVYGRIKGPRDEAADGFTRHAWVKINGRYYDPEGYFAGWRSRIYGYKKYPLKVKARKTVKY